MHVRHMLIHIHFACILLYSLSTYIENGNCKKILQAGIEGAICGMNTPLIRII